MTMRFHAIPPLLFALLLEAGPPLRAGAALDPRPELTGSQAFAPLPGGGFVAVWHRERSEYLPFGPDYCVATSLVGAFLDDAGRPAAPPRTIGLPDGTLGGTLRLAATRAGDLALAWTGPAGLQVGRLTPDLAVAAFGLLSSCEIRTLELLAGGDGFWAVWSEACGSFHVRARRLDRRARPVGPVLEVADPAHLPGAGVAAAGTGDGAVSIAWAEGVEGVGRQVLWARYGEGGDRTVSPSPVSPGPAVPGRDLAAAALPGGGVVFAWVEGGRLLLRSFAPDGAPAGGVRPATDETFRAQANVRLAATPAGLLVVAFACTLRVFDRDLEPVGEEAALPESCSAPVVLEASSTGALLASWVHYPDLATSLCGHVEASVPAVDVLPPAVPPITAPEFPDFRFWVRIGGSEPEPRTGVEEPLCLPETVCVSGALPGRTEVLLRIVGPKPNGFLWPTIVRFTTAPVEVWIEQVSTGLTRHYRLEGATPGSDTLPGLFDRTGFLP
jgi:hypothetical protein